MRGERVHGLRPECLRAGRARSSGDGQKVRAPEVPGEGPGRVRAIQRVGTLSDGFGAAGPEAPGWPEVPVARSSGQRPEVLGFPEACPGFFFLLFHASLADGVGDPWRLHSSSSSVKLRQYLCMHDGGSSSIPSSKGSSEHV